MNLTDLRAVQTIIAHDNCADGLASAILLKDALPNAKIRFIQYGTPDYHQLKVEPNMLFCDFSPPAPMAEEFAKAGTIILDHHKGAQKSVALFGEKGVFGDEATEPGVCGAVLAYRHVWLPVMFAKEDVTSFDSLVQKHPEQEDFFKFVERFSTLAGIRDTWQSKSPLWRDGCVHAETLNLMTSERWMQMSLPEIAEKWVTRFLWIGEMLWERHEKKVAKTIRGGHRFTTAKGSRVIVFEGVRDTSDAAEALGSEVDLIVGFNMFEEDMPTGRVQKLIMSSRSHTTYDCLALAKSFGGGGHTKAAGFNREMTMDDPQPFKFVENLISTYEAQ